MREHPQSNALGKQVAKTYRYKIIQMSFVKIYADAQPLVEFMKNACDADVTIAASHFENNPTLLFVTMFSNRVPVANLRWSVTTGRVVSVKGDTDTRLALLSKHRELDDVLRRVFENYVPVSIKPLFSDE